MNRSFQAWIGAGHPGPSLAISAMVTALAVRASPDGSDALLMGPAMLAGQLSIGWSNDAADARRDAAAGRTDKPVATGLISARTIWITAVVSLVVALGLALAVSVTTALLTAVVIGAGWAYNLGLKATLASGAMYLLGFAPLPAYATSALPGHPWPRWSMTVVAGALGLGAHFVNVLPDLDGDRAAGVGGLPQRVAAAWGPGAVRATAIVLLGAASLLLLTVGGLPPPIVAAGLVATVALGVVGATTSGRTPFLAAIALAGVDVALLVLGGTALT
ncbi:UbiA family prenyltransferase [Cryptosporangium sp. NPDC051539]|uniref:UbiA family prenyltransferase n=1 Tax=Cryptosporangium sp. NPDC051539 TaxID=3363962 RepID=UPI0037AEA860